MPFQIQLEFPGNREGELGFAPLSRPLLYVLLQGFFVL